MKSLRNRRFGKLIGNFPNRFAATPARPIAFGLQILDCRRVTSRKPAKFGRFGSATRTTAHSLMSKAIPHIGSGSVRMVNTRESFPGGDPSHLLPVTSARL